MLYMSDRTVSEVRLVLSGASGDGRQNSHHFCSSCQLCEIKEENNGYNDNLTTEYTYWSLNTGRFGGYALSSCVFAVEECDV